MLYFVLPKFDFVTESLNMERALVRSNMTARAGAASPMLRSYMSNSVLHVHGCGCAPLTVWKPLGRPDRPF